MRKWFVFVFVKVWRCGMNVDDEFDIEIRINGLRGKKAWGVGYIRKNRNLWEPKQLFVYLCVFSMR